jgi:hypothetical protein
MLAVTYGTKVKQNDSRIIVGVGEQVSDYLSDSLTPLSILVDAIPFLKSTLSYPILVPLVSPFLPNAFSKSKAEWSDLISRFRNDLFAHVQELVVSLILSIFFSFKRSLRSDTIGERDRSELSGIVFPRGIIYPRGRRQST